MLAAVLGVVMALVVVVAVTVVVISLDSQETPVAAPAAEATAGAGPSPEPAGPAGPTGGGGPEEPDAADGEPLLEEGWQRVPVRKWDLVYEVPSGEGWDVGGPDRMLGWEDPDGGGAVMMSGVATYREGWRCSSRNAGTFGVRGVVDSTDTREMGEALARQWARAAYDGDAGASVSTVESAEEYTANGLSGHRVTLAVDVHQADEGCDPPTANIHVLAVGRPDGGEGVRALIVDQHTGVDDMVSDGQVDRILATVRDTAFEDGGA